MSVYYPFRNLVFQGGGVKALAYHGALEVLEAEGVLDQMERVAGTSAGAFLAALVAMRLSVKEIRDIYQTFDFARLTMTGAMGRLVTNSRAPRVLERELERIHSNFAAISRLARRFGWYSAEYGYQWMQETLADCGCEDGLVTFSDFRSLGFRDLHVVVTNLSTHSTEVFCADRTPDVAVVDALLMSQALPLFFEALQFDGLRFGNGDHYADGGILLNYPLHIFDERPFASNNRWFVNGVNWETLGCRLYRPAGCPKYSRPITNVLTYAQNVIEALVSAQNVAYDNSKTAQRRTINVSDCCIRAIDFHVQPEPENEDYQKLVAAGREAARGYLRDYQPPLIKPLLPVSFYLDRWWRALNGRFTH